MNVMYIHDWNTIQLKYTNRLSSAFFLWKQIYVMGQIKLFSLDSSQREGNFIVLYFLTCSINGICCVLSNILLQKIVQDRIYLIILQVPNEFVCEILEVCQYTLRYLDVKVMSSVHGNF